MNLENLKFRAWDKEDDRMKEVFNLDFHRYTAVVGFRLSEPKSFLSDRPLIIMQSTGLFDLEGVEIFEGDIIEEPYNSNPFRNSTLRSIEMYHGAWVARDIKEPILGEINIPQSILRDSKVIGNIYENEDLLK